MRADVRRSALFLGLVLLFSLPLLLLPGELPGGLRLPPSAAMAVAPLLAALAAARLTDGTDGPRRVLAHLTRWHVRRGWWWLVLAGTPPLVLLAAADVVPVVRGGTGDDTGAPLSVVVVMAVVFVVSGLTEQVGWTGYLQPLWQPWVGRPVSGVVIGAVWGLWHVGAYAQAGWGAGWIAGQVAYSVALRVVLQELVAVSGGGVTAAAVVQAGSNTAWLALPPSLYDPAVAALVTTALAAVVLAGRVAPRTAPPTSPSVDRTVTEGRTRWQ